MCQFVPAKAVALEISQYTYEVDHADFTYKAWLIIYDNGHVQVHLKEQGLGGQGALVTEVAMLRGQHVALLRDAQDKKARLNNAGTVETVREKWRMDMFVWRG